MDLKEYDLDLYFQFIYFPAEMIMCFDEVIRGLYEKMYIMGLELDPDELELKQMKRDRLMVAIRNLGEVKVMRDIC